jgi:hypothetical protein
VLYTPADESGAMSASLRKEVAMSIGVSVYLTHAKRQNHKPQPSSLSARNDWVDTWAYLHRNVDVDWIPSELDHHPLVRKSKNS